MSKLLIITSALALLSPPARADNPDTSFNGSTVIATSSLSSVVTNSTVSMQNTSLIIGGNSISDKAFEGVKGVIAVIQNTGVNANVQQLVNIATGTIKIGLTQ
jgi:hypothetical protein